ncbi:flagellar biosynthetic protein FliO [Clostridium estertheticum]|uniref:flagellar biosynthetic protein FliO n=1 Tax=Clostridium estertheticum TaxID=238834 RepID=UPI001CF3E3B6|nr:flagellar biosynthetic protein FliO [Clostridium estertheticum]MCB2308770.1 flagellar biosynthetic protein FliO [Clostridium estertheticum]MCB2347152.1 flagellar biosynthetic protein FliO [Clostridium estertheticum]MCB2351756.1 flagellar biosynthetic protein FliO [Clostridium estertheticum]WAG44521.1 flagellar biosynthetic protein FliO [Clostridium estertheticum]
MEKDFWILMFKIIIFLPFILFMLYLSLKYGGTKLRKLQDGRYMRILDRISLSKENSITVVKIGDKAYAVSSSLNDVKILFELPSEEIIKIEKIKELPQYEDMKDLFKKHIFKKQTKEEVRYENKK